MNGTKRSMQGIVGAIALAIVSAGCAGSDGGQGPQGPKGDQGDVGLPGNPGGNAPVAPLAYSVFTGSEVSTKGGIAQFHGQAVVTAEDEAQGAPANPKFLAKLQIVGASVDPSGVASVVFTVKAKDGVTAVTNLTAASASIFKLAPAGSGRSFNRWVPYIYRSGRTVNAGYRESNGSFTNNGGGRYTYVFATNLTAATFLWDPTQVPGTTPGGLVGFDPALTHRVSIYLGGHSGPTGEADFDFVPNGGPVTETRNIVQTAACQKCHAANEFRGHGGDRVTVEGCNTCHSPDGFMVNGAVTDSLLGYVTTTIESIAMQVMIHKMHAGRELQSAPGADGVWFDDPATPANEAADNGTYRMGSLGATWRSAAFPAGLANCTVCHYGSGQDVDHWKTVPSREACGSCHDLVNWTTGANHAAGAQANDNACAGCHTATKIAGNHDFMTKDIRNAPEFAVTVSVSTPGNGTNFVAGEAPVLTIKLWNLDTNQAVDHTTILEDPSGEGCVPNATYTACTNAADGLFRNANLYVTGPRAKRIPVLTTAARAKVSSATIGPWNLSAGGSLRLIVDGGNFIVNPNHLGEDVLVPGDITIALPANATALFANPAAATAAEVVAWLNGATATVDYNEREFLLGDRAFAYVDNGKVSIRSRARGSFNPSIQVPETAKALGIFTDTAVKVAGSGTQVRKRTDPANNDPQTAWFTDRVEVTLDPVDDLAAGTYMVNVEFADRGRPSNAANYRTPSIAVATFQVKQAAVEKPVAAGCTSCHWSTSAVGQGIGLVMDPVRHNKPFNAQALDQCGGCHGYKSGETVAARTWTTGGGNKAISKRVHAVHGGASLNYPVLTVDHEESVPGRDWRIVYPQELRNCESCHPAGTTSGTWATVPNRLACMGCHDSDGATIHMKSQVYDPTPTAPWSGDESEACAACH